MTADSSVRGLSILKNKIKLPLFAPVLKICGIQNMVLFGSCINLQINTKIFHDYDPLKVISPAIQLIAQQDLLIFVFS